MSYIISSLMICAVFCASAARAAQPIMYQGENITPLVEYFEKYVHPLTKPVTVYNYSAGAKDPFWQKERDVNDPTLLYTAQSQTEVFWQRYGEKDGSGYMYGFGLYAAVDPILTYSYGGGIDSWVLLQMQLPVGFKLVDVTEQSRASSAVDHKELLRLAEKFKCPSALAPDSFFVNGGSGLTPDCLNVSKFIFSQALKIDGFAYGYGSTYFKACSGNYDGYKAFVITSPDWMKSEHIRYFTPITKGSLENRILIQTMFLAAAQDSMANDSSLKYKLIDYLKMKPDRFVKSSSTTCAGEFCVITAQMCDDKQSCEPLEFAPLPRPGGPNITMSESKRTMAQRLLWPDLEGTPKTTMLIDWLRKNKYACSGDVPYAADLITGKKQ
jgi:hypothetical protein